MDGLNEVLGGATDVAPVTQGNDNGVAAAEPVQPAQPVEAVSGIAIERVTEVIERDPGFLGEAAPLPVTDSRKHWKRQSRLENSPYFEKVKTDYQSGVKSKPIAQALYDQKAFPDLTLPGVISMVARALMRAGLMKLDARVSGFTPRTRVTKPSRASFTSSQGGKLLSTRQIAKRYKVLESSVRSWVKRGALSLQETGATNAGRRGQWLFPLAAIERWERKRSTFEAVSAVRNIILRQQAAYGKTEAYLSAEQIGARYGISGSGVNNWITRGVLNKSEILANGGFEGDGRTLFVSESYLRRWEKTPVAQALASVRDHIAHPVASASASRGNKTLTLNDLGARYGVTGGAVWLWIKRGEILSSIKQFFDKGSHRWRIPISSIESWEQSPEARRAALHLSSLRRFLTQKHPMTPQAPPSGVSPSQEVDVSAIARKTGLPSHHIRRVLETVGLQPKGLKLSQVAITQIEQILTSGGEALVKKDDGSGFIVRVAV